MKEMKPGKAQLAAWESLVIRFSRTWDRVEADVNTSGAPVPLHWYDVLLVLSRAPSKSLKLSEIAERVVSSRAAISRSFAKMEEAGLVKRETCPNDGRVQLASVTAAGEAAFRETWPKYRSAIETHFGRHLDATEAKALSHALRKLPLSPTDASKSP